MSAFNTLPSELRYKPLWIRLPLNTVGASSTQYVGIASMSKALALEV